MEFIDRFATLDLEYEELAIDSTFTLVPTLSLTGSPVKFRHH